MKIGIYNEPGGNSIGGSECCVAVLAEALGGEHQVEIVHHKRAVTGEQLDDLFGTDLRNVRLRYVAPQEFLFGSSRDPRQRYKEARAWHAALSNPYDLFINFAHNDPPFCHAPKGMLVVLFPFHERRQDTNLESNASPVMKKLKSFYFEWEWKKRLQTYQVKTAISQFSRAWTKRRWRVDCEILYPPTGSSFGVAEKRDAILSVGRFTTSAHTKKQLEMMTAFQELKQVAGLDGWDYFCVGGLGDLLPDHAFFENVRRIGETCGAQALANVERHALKRLYEESKVFWHATGYGVDEAMHPELTEHYGISTVEAMTAGCVPVVINKGGQKEIVEHGVSGFLWNTPEELKEYTLLVMRDESLRERMSVAARARAERFSRAEFVRHSMSLLQPLLS